MKIEDSTGTGKGLKIDNNNRATVQSISRTDVAHAALEGTAWNIHSGEITFSAAGTMMYIKNNEAQDLIIENMIVATGSGTVSDSPEVKTYKDVTGGDLLTDATAIGFQANRNYGSEKALAADMYAGKSGGTITAEQVGLYYTGTSTRLVANINKVLPRGTTLGIYLDPKLSSGTIKAYCVITVHLKEAS